MIENKEEVCQEEQNNKKLKKLKKIKQKKEINDQEKTISQKYDKKNVKKIKKKKKNKSLKINKTQKKKEKNLKKPKKPKKPKTPSPKKKNPSNILLYIDLQKNPQKHHKKNMDFFTIREDYFLLIAEDIYQFPSFGYKSLTLFIKDISFNTRKTFKSIQRRREKLKKLSNLQIAVIKNYYINFLKLMDKRKIHNLKNELITILKTDNTDIEKEEKIFINWIISNFGKKGFENFSKNKRKRGRPRKSKSIEMQENLRNVNVRDIYSFEIVEDLKEFLNQRKDYLRQRKFDFFLRKEGSKEDIREFCEKNYLEENNLENFIEKNNFDFLCENDLGGKNDFGEFNLENKDNFVEKYNLVNKDNFVEKYNLKNNQHYFKDYKYENLMKENKFEIIDEFINEDEKENILNNSFKNNNNSSQRKNIGILTEKNSEIKNREKSYLKNNLKKMNILYNSIKNSEIKNNLISEKKNVMINCDFLKNTSRTNTFFKNSNKNKKIFNDSEFNTSQSKRNDMIFLKKNSDLKNSFIKSFFEKKLKKKQKRNRKKFNLKKIKENENIKNKDSKKIKINSYFFKKNN